jgi:hypothetical protein
VVFRGCGRCNLPPCDYFPDQLPDAYLRFELEDGDAEFFVLILYSCQQFFAAIRRLQYYIKYQKSGDWDEGETDFPALIMAFESQTDQKRFHKKVSRVIHEAPEDIWLYTVTLEGLKAITEPDQKVLKSYHDSERLYSFLDA